MTSASELFHSRRHRYGLRHNTIAITGFDSAITDPTSSSSSSSSSYQHRSSIRRHIQHHSSHNSRHDLDACVPASRRIHRHRPHHLEHQAEEGGSHSPSGSSSSSSSSSASVIVSEDLRSIERQGRLAGTRNDRLPGSVLLARERLVERLRGFTVSGNSQSRGSSSTTHQNDLSTHNMLGIRNNTTAGMVSESWLETRRKNHPLGLDEDELKCLQLEAFSNRQNDERSSASMECTICLEGFEDGDKIVCLVCTHRFHSCCLFPWLRVSGACPNCRKHVK